MTIAGKLVEIKSNGMDGRKIEFLETMTMGRHERNDIFVDIPTVSRKHLRLSVQDNGKAALFHLSKNSKTYVGGKAVEKNCVLQHGDIIEVAKKPFRFEYVTLDDRVALKNIVNEKPLVDDNMTKKKHVSNTAPREDAPDSDSEHDSDASSSDNENDEDDGSQYEGAGDHDHDELENQLGSMSIQSSAVKPRKPVVLPRSVVKEMQRQKVAKNKEEARLEKKRLKKQAAKEAAAGVPRKQLTIDAEDQGAFEVDDLQDSLNEIPIKGTRITFSTPKSEAGADYENYKVHWTYDDYDNTDESEEESDQSEDESEDERDVPAENAQQDDDVSDAESSESDQDSELDESPKRLSLPGTVLVDDQDHGESMEMDHVADQQQDSSLQEEQHVDDVAVFDDVQDTVDCGDEEQFSDDDEPVVPRQLNLDEEDEASPQESEVAEPTMVEADKSGDVKEASVPASPDRDDETLAQTTADLPSPRQDVSMEASQEASAPLSPEEALPTTTSDDLTSPPTEDLHHDSEEDDDVQQMRVVDLRKELKEMGLTTTGLKASLVERLTSARKSARKTPLHRHLAGATPAMVASSAKTDGEMTPLQRTINFSNDEDATTSSTPVSFGDQEEQDEEEDVVEEIGKMKVVELRAELKALGEKTTGLKADLVERLTSVKKSVRKPDATQTRLGNPLTSAQGDEESKDDYMQSLRQRERPSEMKTDALKAELRNAGMPTNGRKAELVARVQQLIAEKVKSFGLGCTLDGEEWKIEGHSLIGKHVRRNFDGNSYDGIVVGFLPANGDDGELFHILHEDGDAEDLDGEDTNKAVVEYELTV